VCKTMGENERVLEAFEYRCRYMYNTCTCL